MDELTAIRQLLPEPPPPAPDDIAAARARLERATRDTGAPRRRSAPRRRRLAVAGGLVAAAAAALIAAQVVAPAGTPPAGALTVHELSYRAAAAASRQPAVPPGQWVFWREKTDGPGCGSECGASHVWTTADSGHAAWVYRGKVVSLGTGPFQGQPRPYLAPQGGWAVASLTGKIPVSYAALRSLPRDPRTLDRYLGRLRLPHLAGWGPPPVREFTIIEMMLTSYLMPPRLTAELYRALGDIPGVTVSDHAVDVAGRHGVGFMSPALPGGGYKEIILNSRSYDLMGDNLLSGARQQVVDGTAILQKALVSGPGVRP